MPPIGTTATATTTTTTIAAPIQQLQHQQHVQQKQQQLAPTTSHAKLQQQHSLPLQLHYPQQQQQPPIALHQQVTTTQPSPAGTFINQSAGIISTSTMSSLMTGGGDISPVSSTGSFSSADTNQTLLNSIANQHLLQQQQQPQQHSLPGTPNSVNRAYTNRSYRTKYSQFMIITPAVAIDRDCNNEATNVGGGRRTTSTVAATTALAAASTLLEPPAQPKSTAKTTTPTMDNEVDDMSSYFNNGNIFRMSLLQGSIDSGCSSDSSSFRSNYNPYLHTSRQHLLPKSTPQNFYTFSSWRWCTLICAAMRCFGAGHSSHAPYSTSFARPPYQRSRSNGGGVAGRRYASSHSATPHQRLRQSSSFTAETAFEHFSAPFTPRKTRDHMNNITYEL